MDGSNLFAIPVVLMTLTPLVIIVILWKKNKAQRDCMDKAAKLIRLVREDAYQGSFSTRDLAEAELTLKTGNPLHVEARLLQRPWMGRSRNV